VGSLIALLAIVLVSLLVVRLGTNALVLTGMAQPAAVFQSASAFFGVGFTTQEAEMVVNHPVRRRVVLHLIVAGNIGLTSAMATLIVTFVASGDQPVIHTATLVGVLILGIVTVALLLNIPIVKKPLDAAMRYTIEKVGAVRPIDYEMLLRLREGFCVSDVEIFAGHPLAGKQLMASRPSDQGIVILGIYHEGKLFEGAPNKNAKIEAGDVVMVYGSEEAVGVLVAENPEHGLKSEEVGGQ